MINALLLLVIGATTVLVAANASSLQYENEPLYFRNRVPSGDKRLLPFVGSPDDLEFASPVIPLVTTTLENYPNPLTHPKECNRQGLKTSYVCDPDIVVHRQDADRLEEKLADLRASSRHSCGTLGRQPFIMAVAVIRKLPRGVTADEFATELLDRWGIGHSECHDGIIFVYAQEDGVSVLKWKKGVEPYMNHPKYRKIHRQIKAEFKRRPVGQAINKAVDLIGYYISGEVMPPRQAPQLVVLFTIAVLVALAYLGCIATVVADSAIEAQLKAAAERGAIPPPAFYRTEG